MAPMPTLIIELAPLIMTTLGLFEFNLVYCPARDHFHISALGNSQEEMKAAKFNTSVPFSDINVIPRQLYIYKDVEDCEGSGEPIVEGTPHRVYLAINFTSERLIAVETPEDATRIQVQRSGNHYVVGYNQTIGSSTHLKLLKAVVPFVTDDDNATSPDFRNSYITIEDIISTDDYAIVHLFGRDCVDMDCNA